MGTYRLVLEYDGSGFAGWQRQVVGVRTVQGALEHALAEIAAGRPAVLGASRTDAGVHAEGQVASVRLETRLDTATLRRALNAMLPPDVVVRSLALAPEGFHALRDARSKVYRYAVWNGDARSPLRAKRFHHQPGPLDVAAMRAAASCLVGRHDFASFQSRAANWQAEAQRRGVVRSTVRTLFRADLEGEAGGEIRIELEGDGFLRQMVRSIAGTLLEVGRGHRRPESIPDVLAARHRPVAGAAAPAAGLTLVRVGYPPEKLGDPPAPAGPDAAGRAETFDRTRA